MCYDSSDKAFKFYGNIYNYKLQPDKTLFIKNENVSISGDIVFNFNTEKMNYYCSVIDSDNSTDKNTKKYCKEILEILSKYYDNNILNISAYPKTGGLNNIKQNLGNDRLDVFVSALFLYYQGIDSFILSSGSKNLRFYNREILKTFLNEFSCESAEKSLYKIMNFLYQISDPKLIDDLKDNGMKHFYSTESILQYCSLVIRFWKNRAENICKDEDRFLNEDLLKSDIDEKISALNDELGKNRLKRLVYKTVC